MITKYRSFVLVLVIILQVFSFSHENEYKEEINNNNNSNSIDSNYENSDYNSGSYDVRITGGHRPEEHVLAKHIVSLRLKQSNRTDEIFGAYHICAGSILSSKIILTAGHCVINLNEVYEPRVLCVVAGSPIRVIEEKTTQIIDIQEIVLHPEFNMTGFLNNDLAILHLVEDIREDDLTAQRIPLTSKETAVGTVCTTGGWGAILPNGPLAGEITYVNLAIVSNEECGEQINRNGNTYILDTHICAKDSYEKNSIKGTCNGDSGGPLINDGTLVGVLSFAGRYGCEGGQPLVFSDVFIYRNWIENRSIKLNVNAKLFPLIISSVLIVVCCP